MAPGASAEQVLEALYQAALVWQPGRSGAAMGAPGADAEGEGARLARHSRRLLQRGASPIEALDSALVALLFAAERGAVETSADADTGTVTEERAREIASRWESYPDRLRDEGSSDVWPGNPRRNLQLMVTRRCQLRCTYCPVDKGDRDMSAGVVDRAVDLLLTARSPRVRLDLTGGEALLREDLVRRAVDRLAEGASARGKQTDLYMVTNGLAIDGGTARWLAEAGFELELSLDGPPEIHNRWKVPRDRGVDPYGRTRAAIEAVLAAGGRHRVVMVVTPETVTDLPRSFRHVVDLGVRKVDVNYAVGRRWRGEPLRGYLDGLRQVVADHRGAIRGGDLRLGNLGSRNEPSILNAEWMVDTDGSLHRMTEWALEAWRPSGVAEPSVGYVFSVRGWYDIYTGRFHAYLTLLRTYAWRDPALRETLLDSVITGREVARAMGFVRRELS